MYYKAFTNNGKFHPGYIYNITNVEELRSYFIFELKNQYNDDCISEEEYNELKPKIKDLNLEDLVPKAHGEQTWIDGFVEELFVTASNTPFPIDELEDFQHNCFGNAPWNKKTNKISTKKTEKPTVKAEPKKIAKSTAKVKIIPKVDANKTAMDEIKIGDQTWTTKNLDVDTYCNGDSITHVEDEEEWANLTTGAWCYYENETENGTTYGKLYNWFAVNDPRGLAPKGYHIPSDAEWTILSDNLGDEAGTKMKSTTGWNKYGNGTNESSFAGLPGGYRDYDGDFHDVGAGGHWWSSSENDTSDAWFRALGYGHGDVFRNDDDKQIGFSVRCLRD